MKRGIPLARGAAVSLGLAALLFGLTGCPAKKVEVSGKPALSAQLQGVVKGGKGSGVVGGPIEGVQVSAQLGDKVVGPALSDASGSFVLDVFDLFPAGTQKTPDGLKAVKPITVDVKFDKQGYKSQVETVTFPVPQFEEFTFYLSSAGE